MPTLPPHDVFYWKPMAPEGRKAVTEAAMVAYPALKTPREAQDFLSRVVVPASFRWAYILNGKCATSSTLRFLFEMEFGVPLTVALQDDTDLNPDTVAHRLHRASVLRKLAELQRGAEVLPGALRLSTVRHPATRALSAFFYLCTTQDRAHPFMAEDRIRMNAIVGFDWTADSRTAPGFVKFLRYIDHGLRHNQHMQVNPHWRPQVTNTRPDAFQPDLIGKVEDLASFYRAVAARLDRPLPPGWREPHTNAQPPRDVTAFDTPESCTLIARIYADDFAAFGYDVGAVPPVAKGVNHGHL